MAFFILAAIATMQVHENIYFKGFIILFLFVTVALGSSYLPGHLSDMSCWINWSTYIHENGLKNAYHSGTNYLPMYQYFLWLYAKIMGTPIRISHHIGYLRWFTLLFDFLGLWFVYKWIDRKTPFYLLLVFNILNIAYNYNSIIWGQVDGILATLAFVSLYYAWQKKIVLSSLFFLLALNMKLQAIVFLPLFGLSCLHALVDTGRWKSVLYALAAMIGVQALILFPFYKNENTLPLVWNVVTGSVDQFPTLSMNAFNLWHLVTTGNPMEHSDATKWIGGITYKQVGLFLFFTSALAALWPLLKVLWLRWKGKAVTVSREQVWLVAALINLLFFFFNTQMHERYCHPAFIFITAYSFYTGRFLPYILFSSAYFLNLEKVLQFIPLRFYDAFFYHPKFIASLFLLTIVHLFILLYRTTKGSEHSIPAKTFPGVETALERERVL